MQYHERLVSLMKKRNVRNKDIMAVCGVTNGAVSQWKRGDSKPKDLICLAEAFNTSPLKLKNYLESGIQIDDTKEASKIHMNDVVSWDDFKDLPESEYISVPRYDVHVSAGNGTSLIWDEIEKDQPNAFRASFFKQLGIKPENAKSIYAKGDSMEQRIFDGDSLTIDVSQTSVINDRIYVIRIEDEVFVKKLIKRPGGGLEIASLNPAYKTMILSPDEVSHVEIVGRVVHVSSVGGL